LIYPKIGASALTLDTPYEHSTQRATINMS